MQSLRTTQQDVHQFLVAKGCEVGKRIMKRCIWG